jgi:tetrahydromethanopterin S-methyltransferase subunit A
MSVQEIIAQPSKQIMFDKKGFFVIFIKDNLIIVEHYTTISKGSSINIDTGKLKTIIKGSNSLEIGQTIIREGLLSRTDHAIYLGRELMKAEIALKYGTNYEQCKSLDLNSIIG